MKKEGNNVVDNGFTEDVKALLFQPKFRSNSLLRYLSKSFRDFSEIKEAYFCCLREADSKTKPFIVLALNLNEDLAILKPKLSKVLEASGFERILVVDVNTEPFYTYFSGISSFYQQ
jgi:hypothetical protein